MSYCWLCQVALPLEIWRHHQMGDQSVKAQGTLSKLWRNPKNPQTIYSSLSGLPHIYCISWGMLSLKREDYILNALLYSHVNICMTRICFLIHKCSVYARGKIIAIRIVIEDTKQKSCRSSEYIYLQRHQLCQDKNNREN